MMTSTALFPFRIRRLISVCLGWILLLAPARAETTYIVKRNDTLTAIGRQYGISVAKLAAYNDLDKKDKILVGQKLLIPSKAIVWAINPALPSALAKISVSSRWKYIVIHHSGVSEGDVKSIDRYHREVRHMENGLAYHFLIGNGHRMKDGEIAIGNRWTKQLDGGHVATLAQNRVSIGICLVGNFDKQRPTRKQMESLRVLTRYLLKRCKLKPKAVMTHQQINVHHTRCPGRYFPTKSFLQELKETS
jgi:LysM repeat protein